jgi:hypothetical protein
VATFDFVMTFPESSGPVMTSELMQGTADLRSGCQ